MNRGILFAPLVIGMACGHESPSGTSAPVTTSIATTTSVPTSSSTSTTSSTPPSSSNRPPTVRVTGDEGCHPRRYGDIYPCTVHFRAEASDPDGDDLSYRWSGCASGQAAEASCVIDQLHTVTATVAVTDARGGRAEASKSAQGTNRPPVPGSFVCRYRPGQNPGAPDCGAFEACPPPLPTNGIGDCIDGSFGPFDFEGDRVTCGPILASGACHGPVYAYECGGAATAFSFEFRTGAEEGECVLEISISDSWGATSSTTVRVPVREYP